MGYAPPPPPGVPENPMLKRLRDVQLAIWIVAAPIVVIAGTVIAAWVAFRP
jgi:hypothetical protein